MYATPCGCGARRRALAGYSDGRGEDDMGDTMVDTGAGGSGGGGGGTYVPPPPTTYIPPTTTGDPDPVPVGPVGSPGTPGGDPGPSDPGGWGEPGGTIITDYAPGADPTDHTVDLGPPPGAGEAMLEWLLGAILAAALVSRR